MSTETTAEATEVDVEATDVEAPEAPEQATQPARSDKVRNRKPARPRWLNVFRPLLTERTPAFARAAERLAAGASVGIFPEGTVNRDPNRLLRGFHGAAQLSLTTGVPIVPAGIRFPQQRAAERIPELAPMGIEFGAPLVPPVAPDAVNAAAIRAWHATMMQALARLSGKRWSHERKFHA